MSESGKNLEDLFFLRSEIEHRAYSLWQEAGSPIGDGVDFWLQAEKEVRKRLPQKVKKNYFCWFWHTWVYNKISNPAYRQCINCGKMQKYAFDFPEFINCDEIHFSWRTI